MGISEAAWDGSASNYSDADAYCKACLIDENPSGQDKTKQACKLPVYTPNGDLNRNAVHSAAAVMAGGMGGVSASPQSKKAAARKLIRLYGELKETPPDSLKKIAGQ